MATLADFCTEQNKIGSSYYSDTYSALMTYDGERRPWNIIHIGIPFSKEKELALRARFGLEEDELPDFYTKFARNVKRSLDIQEALAEMTAHPGYEDLQKATLIAKKIVVTKKDSGGSDIYLLTDEAVPITKSAIIYNDTISIRNLYNLGARLLQSIKLYAKAGINIGSYDVDDLYVVEQDGRPIIKYAGFLASAYKGSVPEYTEDIIAHIPAEVRSGEVPPSLGSDIYSLCSLVWTLLSGGHYTDPPDLTAAPQYASPEAVELLRKGMTERERAIRDLANGFRALAKESQGQKIFPAPVYMPTYQTLLETAQKTDGSADITGGVSPENEQSGKSGRKPLPPVTKKAIHWTAALAASFAISFMAGKIVGSAGLIPIAAAAQELPVATASVEVTTEPSPTVAPESASPEPTPTPEPSFSPEPTEAPTPTPAPTEAPPPTPQPTQKPAQRPAYTPAPRPEYPQYPVYTQQPVYTPAPTPPPVPTPPPSTPAPTLPPTPMPSIAFEFEQYEPVIELAVGGTYRIYPTLSCWWDISDRSIVSVSTSAFEDGTTGCEIQALAPGSCTVTAVCTDQDHYGERISVTVNIV